MANRRENGLERRLLALAAAVAGLVFLSACGTVSARTKSPGGLYSGVGYDLEKVSSGDEWLDWSIEGSSGNVPFFAPRGLLWIIDLPLTLAGDTLMIPYDALRSKPAEPDEPKSEEPR